MLHGKLQNIAACSTFPFSHTAKAKKKCLSLSMTKKLLVVVLPLRSLTRKRALEKIKYLLKRNNTAHQGHRKKQVAIAKELGVQMSL
jgi:hypothetical protein